MVLNTKIQTPENIITVYIIFFHVINLLNSKSRDGVLLKYFKYNNYFPYFIALVLTSNTRK